MRQTVVGWLRRLALRALGVDAVIDGLRRDHDAHTAAIQSQIEVVDRAIGLMQRTQSVALSVNNRLTYYEQTIDPVKRAFMSLRRRYDREQRSAEARAKLLAGPADLPPPIDMSEDVAGA